MVVVIFYNLNNHLLFKGYLDINPKYLFSKNFKNQIIKFLEEFYKLMF